MSRRPWMIALDDVEVPDFYHDRAARAAKKAEEAPEAVAPEPFDPFPVEAFPPSVREYISTVAESNCVDPALPPWPRWWLPGQRWETPSD